MARFEATRPAAGCLNTGEHVGFASRLAVEQVRADLVHESVCSFPRPSLIARA
jgi:hypothetical protein